MSALARFLEPALALIITATMFGSCVARAQVVQPTYVRPSKGSNIEILTGVASAPSWVYSPVFDFTAFSAVQVTVTETTGKLLPNCSKLPLILTEGALSKAGPFTDAIYTENGRFFDYVFSASSITYTVNSVRPYIQFAGRMGVWTGAQVCAFSISMTPLPLQTAMGAIRPLQAEQTTNVVAIPALPGAAALSLSATRPSLGSVRLQNIGLNPVVCVAGGVPTLATANFVLAADTAAGAGKGGVIDLAYPNSFYNLSCGGNGGPSDISSYVTNIQPN